MIKFMRKILGFKETLIPTAPIPESKELTPKDLKPFIKKVYYKHFLQFLKTNQPQLNSNDVWLGIKSSIDNYVDETMDSVAEAIHESIGQQIFWMESDIEDYAEGTFESWKSGDVKSVRDPWDADPALPWNVPDPPSKCETCEEDDVKNIAGIRIEENKKRDNIDEATQWVEKPEEELVDWKDADKAW